MRKRDEPAYPVIKVATIVSEGMTRAELTAALIYANLVTNPPSWANPSSDATMYRFAISKANALWDELEKETGK